MTAWIDDYGYVCRQRPLLARVPSDLFYCWKFTRSDQYKAYIQMYNVTQDIFNEEQYSPSLGCGFPPL